MIVTTKRSFLLVASLLLLVGACIGDRRFSALWLEPGSTAEHLVINLGTDIGKTPTTPGPASGIFVKSCSVSDTLMYWSITRTDFTHGPPVPRQVVYGVTPAGYTVEAHPVSLRPGCYTIDDARLAHIEIEIDSAGHVRELTNNAR